MSGMVYDKKMINSLIWLAVGATALRLLSLSLGILPSMSDAHVLDVARHIAESGDFISPTVSEDSPFWTFAPLSFWASALSMKLFGITSFAARLPSFLFLFGAGALTWLFARRHLGPATAARSAVILATAILFIASMDMAGPGAALAFFVTLCWISFYNALSVPEDRDNIPTTSFERDKDGMLVMTLSRRPFWMASAGYLFFASLGLGFLAAGPVMLPFAVIPILFYVLVAKRWNEMSGAFPWFDGTFIMLAIAVPWYVFAELAMPGFLSHYFGGFRIFGGIGLSWEVWPYWLLGALPWSLYFATRMFWKDFRQDALRVVKGRDDTLVYALCFATLSLVLISLSKSVSAPSALIPLVPSTMLLAALMPGDARWLRWTAVGTVSIYALTIFIAILL